MAATTFTTQTTGRAASPALRSALAGAVGAALVNLSVYGRERAGDLDYLVRFSNDDAWSHITAAQVATVSVLAVLVGAGVAWLAGRWSTRGAAWVRALGAALAVVTVGAPMSVRAVDGGVKPLLAAMHLIAGAGLLYATRKP